MNEWTITMQRFIPKNMFIYKYNVLIKFLHFYCKRSSYLFIMVTTTKKKSNHQKLICQRKKKNTNTYPLMSASQILSAKKRKKNTYKNTKKKPFNYNTWEIKKAKGKVFRYEY